jgi:hypothetical protein
MPIPKHYYNKLSNKNTKTQLKEINKSKKMYKKKQYHTRPKMPSFKSKKSKHIIEFEKKYNVKINDLKNVSKVTNVPTNILKKVINKGMGAYYSSGSRPNQTPHSWGYARLASVLLKHNAYKIDKYLLNNKNINIKPPPKSTKPTKTINCCKINIMNENKHKLCIRKSDNKFFNLPRKYNRKKCKNSKGFTMKSSCAIYKDCNI